MAAPGDTSTTTTAPHRTGPDRTVRRHQPTQPHPRPGGGGHAGEEPLTGDTATQVEAAALAEYPDATVVRLETDSDGVYEVHLQQADGTPVTVEVDQSFAVTGEETHP